MTLKEFLGNKLYGALRTIVVSANYRLELRYNVLPKEFKELEKLEISYTIKVLEKKEVRVYV